MINKKSLWFLTLFSLILVLSIYYITMPNELLLSNNSNYNNKKEDEEKVVVKESETLTAMRITLDEERQSEIETLQKQLEKNELTAEEKNSAYEQIKYLTQLSSTEENLESILKKTYNIACFVKIDENSIAVTSTKEKHDMHLANDIMRTIQGQYKEKKNIIVSFTK